MLSLLFKVLPSSFCKVFTLFWFYLPILSMGSSLSNSYQNSGPSAWIPLSSPTPLVRDCLLSSIVCLKGPGGSVNVTLFSYYHIQTIVLCDAFYKTPLCMRLIVFGYIIFIALDGSHFLNSWLLLPVHQALF